MDDPGPTSYTRTYRSGARLLIVNADDLGMSPRVTEGILRSHERGIVSSTTVLTTPDADLPGADVIAARAPRLGRGLHMNVTWGRPCSLPSTIQSLVDPSGGFPTPLVQLDRLGSLDPDELERELEAQIDRFHGWAGSGPDHLDVHHHILHFHPTTLEVYLRVATRHDLPVRNFDACLEAGRLTALTAWIERENGLGLGLPDPAALAPALAAVRERFPALRVPARAALDFYRSGATHDGLRRLLEELPPGVTEIMCHPALEDPTSPPESTGPVEAMILQDPGIRAILDAAGIRLATFAPADLAGPERP